MGQANIHDKPDFTSINLIRDKPSFFFFFVVESVYVRVVISL
jgi:hypothetical protein